jgi:hypothetical protein
VDKSFGGVARIGDAGQAVGAGRVVVIIGQVVEDSESRRRGGQALTDIGFQVAVEVVLDARFVVLHGVNPGAAVPVPVRGSGQAAGAVVTKAVELTGSSDTVDVRIPRDAGNIAVVLSRCARGGTFVGQAHAKHVHQMVSNSPSPHGTSTSSYEFSATMFDLSFSIQHCQVLVYFYL